MIVGKTRRTQNSTLLLLPVPDNSASQSYLSSCDAKCLSSLFLNEFTEGAVTTGEGRLFRTFVILFYIYVMSMSMSMLDVSLDIAHFRKNL